MYASVTIRHQPLKSALFRTVSSWDCRVLVSQISCAAPQASPCTTHLCKPVSSKAPSARSSACRSPLGNRRGQRAWMRRLHVNPCSAHADETTGGTLPDGSQTSKSNVGKASKSGQGVQCHFCSHEIHRRSDCPAAKAVCNHCRPLSVGMSLKEAPWIREASLCQGSGLERAVR